MRLPPPSPAPEGFRHALPVQVRFGDLDALGHVNNAKYLTYLETARIDYFHATQLWTGGRDRYGVIVASVKIDFKLPLLLADRVTVYTRVSRLGSKSLDTEAVIARTNEDEVTPAATPTAATATAATATAATATAATATVTLVMFDYIANGSIVIPDAWRDRIRTYEPGIVAGA